ncbi:MAG: LPS export ABC transporter ATP-binding protein [Bdellovibrionaceae bacterium]|nr:LPS export ABC transporter ATP-binding protein [Pseudobdellovibrionaceae bacterium]MDW8189574.1 LPS export ABC transporter ATP-binding protein [Pseudobdellovibrionaceae bacterium]
MGILEAIDLKKYYGTRRVVERVSFEVRSGQVVGLLGPNGAGKTTSFYMVIGIVTQDEGKVLLNGQEIQHLPMYRRCRLGLGYLPQEASVFRKLTVFENLKVAFESHGVYGKEAEQRIDRLLDEFNVSHIRDSYGYSLSGGERRRVEIARSLAGNPRFILLDEPFAGVDPIAVSDIQSIIKTLQAKNIGILITDHNVRETLGICDRAYILKDGIIQVQGSAIEIAQNEVAKRFYLGENFKL